MLHHDRPELQYDLHVHLEFGEYVQTHEDHTNEMYERTLGAICLGPNGNAQGGHWFMSLATGAQITQRHMDITAHANRGDTACHSHQSTAGHA